MTLPPIQIGAKLQIWLQILEFAVQEILEFIVEFAVQEILFLSFFFPFFWKQRARRGGNAVQEILEFRRFAKKVGF